MSYRLVEKVSWEMVDQEGQAPSSAARMACLTRLWEWDGVLAAAAAAAAHLNVTRYDACFDTL
jgi:hypothetical protein